MLAAEVQGLLSRGGSRQNEMLDLARGIYK